MIDSEFRYQMMVKGWMNKKELAQFIGCGYSRATRVLNDIQKDIKREGLEKIDDNIVLTDRVIEYLGLTPKKILKAKEKPTAER